MLKLLFAAGTFMLLSLTSAAQHQKATDDSKHGQWFQGEIRYADGTVRNGLLNYNYLLDVLKLKNESGTEIIKNHDVLSFATKKKGKYTREFLALPYDVHDTGMKTQVFFRKLFLNEHYAILSKHVLEVKSDHVRSQIPGTFSTFNGHSQTIVEKIYLANKEGVIIPFSQSRKSRNYSNGLITSKGGYVQQSTNNYTRLEASSTKFKLIQPTNLDRFFGEHSADFHSYTKKNKLKIKYLGDLMRALEFRS